MRIGINCHSFLNQHYAGIGRYALNLVRCLAEIDQENTYYLYAKKGLFDLRKKTPEIPAKNFEVKVDRFSQGIAKTLGPLDIYHAPSPGVLNIDKTRIVVTVHDLVYKAFPKGHTPQTVEATDRQMAEILKKASKIICCSMNTLKDIHKYFDVKADKTCLVYQGVDQNVFRPLLPEEENKAVGVLRSKGIHQPFILFVGTIEPRKNLENLIRAVALLKQKKKFSGQLVVVGRRGWMNDNIEGLIKQCRLSDDILFLGYTADHELRFLYAKAEVFVFPSFYEGFGFPILEAFCCGAAVVTSTVSSCPEVAHDAALMAQPDDPQDIASAIANILENTKLKEVLHKKALQRAAEFSFRKTAQKTLDVYKEVYSS